MPHYEAFYVKIIDGHLFLIRKSNHYLVWLGQKEHVEALDDDSLQLLVSYRLSFDEQCCKSVS
jgi:hypothetical protein